jgi:hypothetical protein
LRGLRLLARPAGALDRGDRTFRRAHRRAEGEPPELWHLPRRRPARSRLVAGCLLARRSPGGRLRAAPRLTTVCGADPLAPSIGCWHPRLRHRPWRSSCRRPGPRASRGSGRGRQGPSAATASLLGAAGGRVPLARPPTAAKLRHAMQRLARHPKQSRHEGDATARHATGADAQTARFPLSEPRAQFGRGVGALHPWYPGGIQPVEVPPPCPVRPDRASHDCGGSGRKEDQGAGPCLARTLHKPQ